MAVELKPIVLTFGAGINSRSRAADVSPSECVVGQNFELDFQSNSLRPRRPFSKVATATNTSSIDGYAQLIKQDGTISTLIQAGTDVYTWDGASAFVDKGNVSASVKLRGPRAHNFTLDEKVIITDLAKIDNVKEWDGTTFQDLTTGLTNLKAKYCRIHQERVIFGNVTENATATPHVLLGSQRGSSSVYSNTDRPSSALGLDAAFFIPAPDLRPINGMEEAFGQFLISTSKGTVHVLSGSNSFDFAFTNFYQGSEVSGDEAIVNIGNDVLFGLPSRIESLSSTIKFGDVDTDDVSRWIAPDIENVSSWTLVYDRRFQRVLCFPNNQGAAWVLHKGLLFKSQSLLEANQDSRSSPWSKWLTTHSTNMVPTTVWSMINPITLVDAVYFGDASGNIYLFDSEDSDTDGGTDVVTVSRTSGLIQVPNASVFDIEGWVIYRKQRPASVTLNFIFGGTESPTETVTLELTGSDSIGQFYDHPGTLAAYYNGDYYYNQGYEDTFRKQSFSPSGQGSVVQVEAIVSGEGRDWQIEEIGIVLTAK